MLSQYKTGLKIETQLEMNVAEKVWKMQSQMARINVTYSMDEKLLDTSLKTLTLFLHLSSLF